MKYIQRRQQLADQVDSGLIILYANDEAARNYAANPYPFRQDSSFLYFTGLQTPAAVLLVDADAGTSRLYATSLGIDHTIWMGEQPTLEELAQSAGIEQWAERSTLGDDLAAAKKEGRSLHWLPPYRSERLRAMAVDFQAEETDLMTGSQELIAAVVQQRSHKTADEIAEMTHALIITRAMHVTAMQKAKPGQREGVIAGMVSGIAESLGNGLAYNAITTINGQILHNHSRDEVLVEGQLFLGDFGAESLGGYAGDITRTWPVAATFSPSQRELYELVLKAQEETIQMLAPGLPFRQAHLEAAKIMTQGLIDMGLMNGQAEDAVAAGAHALFFPHGLGHMIGLDVHDMEDLGEDNVGYDKDISRSDQFGLNALRMGRKLEPGFVVTVEPGLYFIPALIKQWQKAGKHTDFIRYDALGPFMEFGGIRIEDNVHITDTGYEVLGPAIPKTVEEVEAERQMAFSQDT